MATSPEVDDLYADLFSELDSLVAEPTATQATQATQAASDSSADTQELDEALASINTAPAQGTQHEATTAPSTPNAVDTQIENAVRAQFDKASAERRIQELEAEVARAKAPAATTPAKGFFDDIDEAAFALTPDEEEAYKDNIPFIQKLVQRTVNSRMREYDSKRVQGLIDDAADIRNHLSSVGTQVNNTSVEAFGLAVNTAIPDLGAKMRTADWAAYMKQPAPYSNGTATMQDLWSYAESTRNIGSMNEIAATIKLAKDPAAGMVAPGSSRTPAPSPLNTPKKIKYSSYVDAMRKQQNGEMTYDNFLAFQDKFLRADAAGLVDENA